MTKPIILLGEAYGQNEEKIGAGFVGASGIELLRMLDEVDIISLSAEDYAFINQFYNLGDPKMIDAVWRMHPEVHRLNVFNLHPFANRIESFCGPKAQGIPGYPALIKGKHVRAELAPELERLGDELLDLDPDLIVCLGNTALWALSGNTGISKVRGTTCTSTHIVSGFKLLATYHPAAVLRQWELRPVTLADLMKAKREAEYPEIRRPAREIWIEPELEDLERFFQEHIEGCECLSVDIETSGKQITCMGFSPDPAIALVIPFQDMRKKDRNYWPNGLVEGFAWLFIKRVCEDRTIPKLFQNGLYDIAFLWRSYGIKVLGAKHDTMLLSHALQPESLKGLGFLGSIYTDEGAWKNERKHSTTIKADE